MKKRIVIWICMILLCWGCAKDSLQTVETGKSVSEQSETGVTPGEEKRYNTVTVHICGEVYFPGVYTVYEGSRVYEVIDLAGGLTKDADAEAVNQAKEVSDGEQIYIPSVTENKDVTETRGLININEAGEDMLCTIPGIGVQRAKQIIKYREKNGDFESIEEIMKISGIKEGMFEKIAPYITVS